MEQAFYADKTHPGPRGHALLGEAASHMIASQIRVWACRSGQETAGSSSAHIGEHAAQAQLTRAKLASVDASPSEDDEVCYTAADQLPVLRAQSKGWQLIDEGKSKGIPKLFLLSERVGDQLVLGPILPGASGKADVYLGHMRSWKPEQGAFNLTCTGCACSPFWNDYAGYTFPVVQTSSMRTPVNKLSRRAVCRGDDCVVDAAAVQCRRDENGELDPAVCFSLAYDSGFSLEKAEPTSECLIVLTHDVWPRDMPLNTSHVLVSTLAIDTAGPRVPR